MRKLTYAAYAVAYDALSENRQNFKVKAEYDDCATWVIHVACFVIYVLSKAFADALSKTW